MTKLDIDSNGSAMFIKLSLLLFLISCSSTNKSIHIDMKDKAYKHDYISVNVATNLALQAYMRGCTEKSQEEGLENFYEGCLVKAKNFVRSDIIEILDQEVELD